MLGRPSVAADCAFCRVVAGDAGATMILDEPEVVAFLDTSPVFKGHVLVVPREHHRTVADVPPPLLEPLFVAVQRVQRAVMTELGAQGAFVAANNIVSQSVPHLHIHVIPRTKGDGLRGFFWPRVKYADSAEYESYATRLRSALEAQ